MRQQVWLRPWALLDQSGRSWRDLPEEEPSPLPSAALWLFLEGEKQPPRLGEARHQTCCSLAHAPGVFVPPLPLRPGRLELRLAAGKGPVLDFTAFPARPVAEDEKDPTALLGRVKAVWARLRELETALGDPATIWQRLTERWLNPPPEAMPEMDVIVSHARHLPPVLDRLARHRRRILRRASALVPIARVQEVDRRSMLWLARRPGETIAERAGSRQRVQAVVRLENFDTLENRVLLSYAHLAGAVARDYDQRHSMAESSGRVRHVRGFGQRCRALLRELRAAGVREAPAAVVPNFVLQNDAQYHAIWSAWIELLHRRRVLDELWRWQARSWEEFCALLVIVALQSLPGARLLAVSPLRFDEEQKQGCWLHHINPLAVFYLPEQGVIVEVSYRGEMGEVLGRFGAPLWLRVQRLGSGDLPARWPIWPLWSAQGGLEAGEAAEIAGLLEHGAREGVRGGLVLRPVADAAAPAQECLPRAACLTVAPAGEHLAASLRGLAAFLAGPLAETAA